jgi:replicative superfamily II helicase
MMTDSSVGYELEPLINVINECGANDISLEANKEYIKSFISKFFKDEEITKSAQNIAIVLERIASDTLLADDVTKANSERSTEWFNLAFLCRRSNLYSKTDLNLENIFYFSLSGVLSKNLSQVRVLLKNLEIILPENTQWNEVLINKIMKSVILLVRKGNGWGDINESVELIKELRQEQEKFENVYLEVNKERAVPELILLYNLAKIVDLTAQYTLNGSPSNILTKIRKYYDNSNSLVKYGVSDELFLFKDILYLGCVQLIKNTIWYNSRNLVTISKMKDYIESLISDSKSPIIELLPSQQDALGMDPFSIVKRSIVLSMPTSAGKTMMAEFAIVQAISGNENARVVFVVPTRALVNQITLNLRRKFAKMGLVVESAVPVFELDPIEDQFLKKDCNILVSTPEKIDLLIRNNHPSVAEISLVIVDEAHNIMDDKRGAKLELLLTMINQERENVRFLLLSPFIPNSAQIASWLGDEQSKDIKVNWKASDQITAVSYISSKNKKEFLVLKVVPSHANIFVKEEFDVIFNDKIVDGNRGTIKKSSLSTALNLISSDGCVLILCRTRSDTIERASKLIEYLDDIHLDATSRLIIDYLEEEFGEQHALPKLLKKGVAVHHAGLSLEARYLIERLVENGTIKVLAATTTLAQGVNFPIKHVIVESISKPSRPPRDMTSSEFWNIGGRAGRAFYDHIGLIVFAGASQKDVEKYKQFLQADADDLLSSILSALETLNLVNVEFNFNFVRNNPQLANFIQYLLHTVRVSSYNNVISHLDETLMSSLVYYQMKDRQNSEKLIRLATAYLRSLGVNVANNKGYQNLIDTTGFTSISVTNLMSRKKIIKDKNLWNPEILFSKHTSSMKEILDALKDIPEVDLGRFSGSKLNVDEISEIVKSWVNGDSILDISEKYFQNEPDPTNRIFEASKYINDKMLLVSWGMNAMLKVSAFFNKDVQLDEIGQIPAYIYFGTKTKDSLSLRMVGVPRFVSEKLGEQYSKEFQNRSASFSEIRDWLENLDDNDWDRASKFKKMNGYKTKKLWKILSGIE